ncbi:MAG: GntR family transcriptional regulator [Gammaproteobacteria bacterium]|nr:GntR family transcriptional regulator [Gammaproteobacteria bacterium]
MTEASANALRRPPVLAAIERSTLNDQAYESLKRALLTGRIESGMTLTFRGLAHDLGTSMMPVREAVARLVAERALEVLPQKGIRVPVLSAEELDDLWNLRVLLEGEAVARAATRATDEDLTKIKNLRDKVRDGAESGSPPAFMEANSDFQLAIYAAAQTSVFITLVEMLRLQASPHRNDAIRAMIIERPPFFYETLRHHDDLVDAMAAKNAEKARKIRQTDILGFRAFFDEVRAR